MLSPTHWWALRKKFRQSIPGVVTDSYLATVLNMAANSARANVLPFLKTMGLVDQEGKPTERVKPWRDDESYPAVCKAILKDIYPSELLDAIPEPRNDRAKAERWFANQSGVGESASGRMAATYTVLVEADPSKQPDGERKPTPQKKTAQRTEVANRPSTHKAAKVSGANDGDHQRDADREPHAKRNSSMGPEVNINLQIHISADASSDQIDQIFVSMAKHLYKNG